MSSCPRVESREGNGFNISNSFVEGVWGERIVDKFLELGVVDTLVKEERRGTDQLLLALRVRRLEQLRVRHQHVPRRLRARHHHARAPQ